MSKEPGQEVTIICLPPSGTVKRNADADTSSTLKRREVESLSEHTPFRSAQSMRLSNSTIPKTTIPSCHYSEAECISKTAGCATHGKCVKKYTEKVSEDEEGAECWACQCIPSRVGSGQSFKTIYWGGPACQKKDISVPFLLFAGFTIAAVTTISYAIGLLYGIGEEDLPSVLGAGVAPTLRK